MLRLEVVFVQILISLCVREIRDVKHLYLRLYSIVVVTTHPNGCIEFGQTVEGFVQQVVFVWTQPQGDVVHLVPDRSL